MNYQGFANFSNIPPNYGKEYDANYDRGNGVPVIDKNNMTIQDIYRTPFLFLQEHRKNYNNMAPNAIKGIQSESELSKLFFSDENFRRIQKMIRKEVYDRTKGEFRLDVDQDQKDMFIVMRGIYMENARFLPNQIVRQVKRLNEKVVSEVTPGILTSIRQDYGYLKEINKPRSLLPRELSTNNAGRRSLPPLTTVYGF